MSKLDTHPHFAVHNQLSADPFESLVFAPDTVAKEARMNRISAKKAAKIIAEQNTDIEADGQPLITMAWPVDMARKLNDFAAAI